MDENTPFTAEEESPAESEAEQDSSGWDEAWDDETPGADAQADGVDDEDDEEQDQLFPLKHLGQTRTVNRDELITLGQKGLDYDHVREERDDARGMVAESEAHEEFLRQMASEAGASVEDLIDNARAQVMSGRNGISADRALDKVRYERQLSELLAQAGGAQDPADVRADQKRRAGFQDFARTRGDVKPFDIPRDVWLRVAGGMNLSDSYDIYEAGKLRTENRALKESASARAQNEKNTARTAGSRRTAGSAPTEDDWSAFWDDGT